MGKFYDKRNRNTRNEPKKILCVVEGFTEKYFIEYLKQRTRGCGFLVHVFNAEGRGPQYIFTEAKNSFPQRNGRQFDYCWIVFDCDGKHKEFDDAIKEALKKNFEVFYSNDCFDLWYLLHFRDNGGMQSKDWYKKELERILSINNYDDIKADTSLYDKFIIGNGGNFKDAYDRAMKLKTENKNPSKQNPTTLICDLCDKLGYHG